MTESAQTWLMAGVIGGFVLSQVVDLIWAFNGKTFGRKELKEAEGIVMKRGYSAYTYLPSFGVDDNELGIALDKLAFGGKIILDANGNVVGRLLPKVVSNPKLRLVVDNTK